MGFKKPYRKNNFYNNKFWQTKKNKEASPGVAVPHSVVMRLTNGKAARRSYSIKRQAARMVWRAIKNSALTRLPLKKRVLPNSATRLRRYLAKGVVGAGSSQLLTSTKHRRLLKTHSKRKNAKKAQGLGGTKRTLKAYVNRKKTKTGPGWGLLKGTMVYDLRRRLKSLNRQLATMKKKRRMRKERASLMWQKALVLYKLRSAKLGVRVGAFWQVQALNAFAGSDIIGHAGVNAYLERSAKAGLSAEREARLPAFFKRSVSSTRFVNIRKLGKLKILQVNKAFNLSSRFKRKAVARYMAGRALYRSQGFYAWALVQIKHINRNFFSHYSSRFADKSMAGMNKQHKWNLRQGSRFTWWNVVRRRSAKVVLTKRVSFGAQKKPKLTIPNFLSKKRHKLAAWRKVALQRVWRWRFKRFSYKFRATPAHAAKLKLVTAHGQKMNKKVLKVFRQSSGLGPTQLPLQLIKDFTARRKVRAQRKLAKINSLKSYLPVVGHQFTTLIRKHSKLNWKLKAQAKALRKKYLLTARRVRLFEAPLPWWKEKKQRFARQRKAETVRALALFKKTFPTQAAKLRQKKWKAQRLTKSAFLFSTRRYRPNFSSVNARRWEWIKWFKQHSTKHNLRKSLVQWGGLTKDYFLEQDFRRLLDQKKRGVFARKQGFEFRIRGAGGQLKAAQYLVPKPDLKRGVLQYKPIVNTESEVSHEALMLNPMLFSATKAAKAFDFNKFVKVNKVAARNAVDISGDLYSQYITNLTEMGSAVSTVATEQTGSNTRAARVLRKYIQLLKRYFKEVYDNKFIKEVPAASAMHWIREYLRLTSGVKRRVSLWNRFNRVGFHFRPKAKEDEKRGRKKKILFKAKILFDRLFDWLYAQPNARYALASPIRNSIVRDYVVRNQFIFKKQFKLRLPTKLR